MVRRARTATISRRTKETQIAVTLDLDGSGKCRISTGIPFFDHMIETICRHATFDVDLKCKGDVAVDLHHTVEDVGLCFGQAIKQALADKAGIARFGSAAVPMDEALVLASVDLSGRPYFAFDLDLKRRKVRDFEVEHVAEFFRALANAGMFNLHIRQLAGANTHHLVEAAFKACAVALAQAVRQHRGGIPSTKGTL